MLASLGSLLLVLVAFASNAEAAAAAKAVNRGTTLTSWDCCKPACAWTSTLQKSKASGSVKVCNKRDQALSTSQSASVQSSCNKTPGDGYLCSDYSPKPVAQDLSYGFAITDGVENCCKCFELMWTDGYSAGKRMQVQIINEGGSTDNGRQFILLTPGGGVGPNTGGCNSQFGDAWGRQYGGVSKMEDCEKLPDALQGGCYWRWNWASGEVNGWNVTWSQITCPDRLTSISGCQNNS